MNKVSEHWIGQHFLPAIANADCTGLNDQEELQLNAWEAARNGTIVTTNDVDEFALCEVTGLYGPVARVQVWRRVSADLSTVLDTSTDTSTDTELSAPTQP